MAEKKEEENKNREALLLERKKIIFNLVLFSTAAVVVLIGVLTMAWFAINKKTSGTSMGVNVRAMPYTILTRTDSGLYSDVYESLASRGAEWKISSGCNFENHEDAIEGEEETEPGLDPGDFGILEFRVNPNYDNLITVDCIFDVKAYLENTYMDENDDPVTEITEINDDTLLGYVKAHIMLFAGKDPVTGKYTTLIGDDESFKRILEDQQFVKGDNTYVKIYWVWPEHLVNLTSRDNSNIVYAPNERNAVIEYIANNKDGFFKDCNDSIDEVKTDLTTLSNADNIAIYNHYNIKYDNADLDIGNNISYVMLSMQVR